MRKNKLTKKQKKINRKLRQNDWYDISIYIGNFCVQSKIMIRTK